MKKILHFALIFIIASIAQGINAQELVQARCITPATIALDNGEAVIYAKDFDNKSLAYDRNGLGFTFSETIPSEDPFYDDNIRSSVMIINVAPNTTLTFDIYAWDTENNHDKCTVEIHFVNPKTNGVVFGNVDSEEGMLIEMQKIDIDDETMITFSGTIGDYLFTNINSGTYKMAPYLEGDCLDGVSTLDLVLIQKHILQLRRFKTLEQYFIADVNGDRKVDIYDVLQIRRVILGLDTSFINNHTYRFMQKNTSYNSIEEAFEKGLEVYVPVDGDTTQIDFKKIKIGDINNSHSFRENDAMTKKELGITEEELKMPFPYADFAANNINHRVNSIPEIKIHTPDVYADTNSYINVPVVFDNIDGFVGAQFSLKWDTTKLEYNNILNGDFDVNEFQLLSYNKNGELFVLLFSPVNTLKNELSLNVNFKVIGKKGDQIKFLLRSNQGFENAFYNETGPLKYEFESGLVTIGAGCRDKLEVELRQETGEVSIQAEDLYIGAQAKDSILVNGKDSITFTCDDLGSNIVLLHYEGETGTKDCQIEVNVVDNTDPVVFCKNSIEITLNEDFFYELHPEELDAGSYDICGDTLHFSLSMDDNYRESPYVTFDCSANKENYILLNVTNSKGKVEYCIVKVNVNYPEPSIPVLAAIDTVTAVIVPGIGAKVTADMILDKIYPETCPNYYSIRIYDKMPPNTNAPGNVENPVQNPGIYKAAVFSPDYNNVWTTLRVIFPDENTVKFTLPDKIADKDQEVCLGVKVTNFNSITGVSIPVSWNKDILGFSEIKNNLFQQNSNIVIEDNELLYTWNENNGRSLVDNTGLFDICFEATGSWDSKSNILFFSPTKFERPVVTKNSIQIPNYRKNGSIKIKHYDFCSEMTVSLGVEFAEVKASYFNTDIDNTEVILIDGQENKYFYCNDVGKNIVELTVQYADGKEEKCLAKVWVKDKIAPFIKIDADTVFISDIGKELTLENLNVDVFENCSYNYSIYPDFVDCNNSGLVDVTIEITDLAGNRSTETKNIEFICASDCASSKEVYLDEDSNATVDANSFESPDDPVILVNGTSSIGFSCDDIGENVVKLTKKNSQDELSECYSIINVMDNIAPVAVCKQNYEIKLTNELVYELDPMELDNGSYDNCGDISYTASLINFIETEVVFDCESDTSEMVVMTVTDKSGNYNECMTKVIVKTPIDDLICNDRVKIRLFSQDSSEIIPGILLENGPYCDNSTKVELYEDENHSELRNKPFVGFEDDGRTLYCKVIDERTGNYCFCDVSIDAILGVEFKLPEVVADRNQNICLKLKVKRFKNVTSFKFPISWDTDIVKLTNVNPSYLPVLKNMDFYYQSDSSEIIAVWDSGNENGKSLMDNTTLFSLCFNTIGELESYTNIEFNSKSGIVEPETTVQNSLVHADFINGKVFIQTPPDDCTIDTFHFVAPPDLCNKTITGDSLKEIVNQGDTILINGKPKINLDIGFNDVILTIKHSDGSLSRCKSIIDIVDTIPPVAIIDTTKKIVLDENLKTKIQAIDFDGGSYDNCFGLNYDISPKVVDCDSPNPVEVTLYVSDTYGNVSTAKAFYDIDYPDAPKLMLCRDSLNISVYEDQVVEITADIILRGKMTCPNSYSISLFDSLGSLYPQNDNLIDTSDIGNIYLCKVIHPDTENYCYSNIIVNKEKTIKACVKTPRGIPVPDVEILNGYYTDATGCVDLGELQPGTILKPQKEPENSSAMDVTDIALLQKYLLGLIQNFTPYQKIAGDFNNNGFLAASDILEIRKLILGMDIDESWVFVDESYDFSNGEIYEFPDSLVYPTEDSKYNFIGILKGDINFDYGMQLERSKSYFQIKDEVLFKGEPTKISFYNKELIEKFEGLQYTIYYNRDSVNLDLVNSETFPYITQFFNNNSEGVLKISINGSVFSDVQAGTELFKIQITPKENCVLHEVLDLNRGNNYLAYNDNPVASEIITTWKDYISVGARKVFIDNDIQLYPQPASGFVYVKMKTGMAKNIQFSITNIMGQQLIKQKLVNNKIDIHNLKNGLYLVSFEDKSGRSIIKKLIIN